MKTSARFNSDAMPQGGCHPRVRSRLSRTRIDGVTYKIADCQREREDAFRLVHDAYVRNGLMKPNDAGMRITPFHLLPTTDLLVAYHETKLIYTMTLICDDQLGLPMEEVYGAEVESLRSGDGCYLAEVSCLASRPNALSSVRMFDLFVNLSSLMVQSARENGVKRLVIACHPRHARFYETFLGFRRFGPERIYLPAFNRPAVACEHDFERLDHEKYRLYDRVYSSRFNHLELFHQPMLKGDREYFSGATEFCSFLAPLQAVT